MAASCWPNVLVSRIPETERVSSVAALISARAFWVSPLTSRRTLPTRYVRSRKNGSSASDSSASSQFSRNIAITVLIAMAKLLVIELAVSVTTAWTPPTSLASRLWISPVRVSVKKRKGMRWRWPYSAARRSSITFWPTTLLR